MSYGKSNYSKETFKKTGKPNKGPGNNIFRIMPAMHSLADEGKWAVYYVTHWGYQGVHPTDPAKNVSRPFRCIEDKNRNTGMVRQACPECDLYNQKKEEADAYEAALKAKGNPNTGKPYTEDELKSAMKSRNDWLQAHAPERKWYINVMYQDRTFGDYKINHRVHKKGIDAKIQELLESDIDATDLDSGVFFNIKRIGNGVDPPDVVEVLQRPVEGKKGQFELALAPLTPEEQARGLKECRDLNDLGGSVLSFDQIQSLVRSGGDPEKVDKVFGGRLGGNASAAQRASRRDDAEEAPDESSSTEGALKASRSEVKEAVADHKAEVKGVAAKPSQDDIQKRVQAILAKRKEEAEAKAKAEEEAARKLAEETAARKLAEAEAEAEAQAGVDTAGALDMDDKTFMETFGGDLKQQTA